jgi:CheY-like chemotaxis protein
VATLKSTAEHLSALTTLAVDAVKAKGSGLVPRREPFDPLRFAEVIAASLATRAEPKGLVSRVSFADDLPREVTGDPVRLRAALENIIDNAIKFTEQGTVALHVAAEPMARDRARLVFTITDSGIGMTPAEIKRLFRPFAQASEDIARRYGGAGLGLSLVRQLAAAMGGKLEMTSKPGRGSTLRLSVVVSEAASSDRKAGVGGAAAVTTAAYGLHLLCVEDNPYGRVVMNAILGEFGHNTDFVGSGEAAVEAVARGGYDLVLMDIALPGIDGIEATRRIRAMPAPAGDMAIIGISGHAGDEAAARAAGMNAYLVKPVSPKMLSELLASVKA